MHISRIEKHENNDASSVKKLLLKISNLGTKYLFIFPFCIYFYNITEIKYHFFFLVSVYIITARIKKKTAP